MKPRTGSVYLPHLDYTVRFRTFKQPPDYIADARLWIRRDDSDSCTIFLPKSTTPSDIAHELIHALQYICEDRSISFEYESEHMACLMQHLLAYVLNYDWVPKSKRNQ